MKYILKMKNPKTGNIETYSTTVPEDCSEELALSVWVSAGYEIIDFAPAGSAE